MNVQRVTLTGRVVELTPLDRSHLDALSAIGLDPDLWSMTTISVTTRDEMRDYIDAALAAEAAGTALPFVIRLIASGQIAGKTRFHSIVPQHRRLEIGFSWVARAWQRTAVNTEAKYLLLRHAFETLGCERVSFTADVDNERSSRALLRIGATEEARLRNYMMSARRGTRDVRVFSIIAPEWQRVKANLEARLQSSTAQ